MKTQPLKIIKNGLIDENPTFRLVLGTCPTLAVSTAITNGIGMGLAATFVLVCSNVFIAALKDFIPNKVRIPAFVVVIATFVIMVQLFLKGFVPALDQSLGIFIPLIVVNCIILARAESFASKNGVAASFFDGLGIGLGFTIALTLMSFIRELLGNGTILGMPVFGDGFQPALIMIMAPGGFLTFGFMLAIFNKITMKKKKGA
jgi:electron transport complex protein RnfE